MDVEITSRCNLACRYCYFFDNPSVCYEDLPTAQWQGFFDELGRVGVMHVTLQGGEPFLREDLFDLIGSIIDNRMRFSILSNGTRIDDLVSGMLAITGRCDGVQVSVDGPRSSVHDSIRGTGAFDAAVRGIKSLKKHNVPVTARISIYPGNVAELADTVRFLLETLNVNGVSTNAVGKLGRCRQHTKEMTLSPSARHRAMEALIQAAERYPNRITATAGPLAEAFIWNRMAAAHENGDPPFPDGGRLTGCRCAYQSMAVRSDGTYIPCAMLPHLALGRIDHDPLTSVWQNAPMLNALRSRLAIPLSGFAECADCFYRPYCTGNCPALADNYTDEVNRPAPDACLKRYLDAGGILPEVSLDR